MISHDEYGVRCSAYQDLLERIDELNRYMIVLDRPRISLPARARILVLEIKDIVPNAKLKAADTKAITAYLSKAETFCKSFFQSGSPKDQPAVLPLRLPCDSGNLLRTHESVHQEYLKVRNRLYMAL